VQATAGIETVTVMFLKKKETITKLSAMAL